MEWLQRCAFMLRSSFCRKVAYEPGRTPTPEFLSWRVHAVKGGVNQALWAEQFWNGHPRKLDREMLEVCPSAKIGPLENFPLYGTNTFIDHWTTAHPIM